MDEELEAYGFKSKHEGEEWMVELDVVDAPHLAPRHRFRVIRIMSPIDCFPTGLKHMRVCFLRFAHSEG